MSSVWQMRGAQADSPAQARRLAVGPGPARLLARALLALSLISLAGCEQGRIESLSEAPPPALVRPLAARALVLPSGLEAIFQARAGQDMALQAEPVEWGDPTRGALRAGPLAQSLATQSWQVRPVPGEPLLEVGARLERLEIPVAVRWQEGVGTRICRFAWQAQSVDLSALVATAQPATSRVRLVARPESVRLAMEGARVSRLGECPLEAQSSWGEEGQSLAAHIGGYVQQALEEMVARALDVPLVQSLGVLETHARITRPSPYEERRGTMVAGMMLSAAEPTELSPLGWSAAFDVVLGEQRTGCAPFLSTDPAAPERGAQPLEGAALLAEASARGADLGFAISLGTLRRLAQALTYAGFACQGMEDARLAEENAESLALDALALEQLGLDGVEVGSWARVQMVPATVPDLQARPQTNDLRLVWREVAFEIYAEVLGVEVRLLEVTASFEASLRFRTDVPGGELAVSLDGMEVQEASLVSDWGGQAPSAGVLRSWTRRFLLLYLAPRLSLPLPLRPSLDTRLVGYEVRAQDVVFWLGLGSAD